MRFKLLRHCDACKTFSWIVRPAVVELPTGQTATLKDKLLCTRCIKKAKRALESWKTKTGTPTPTQTS